MPVLSTSDELFNFIVKCGSHDYHPDFQIIKIHFLCVCFPKPESGEMIRTLHGRNFLETSAYSENACFQF